MNRRTLYIGGLAPSTDSASLRVMLGQFGLVEDVRVMPRKDDDKPGIAYVTFLTAEAAMHAQRVLDGSDFEGARLRVDIAR